MTGKRSVIGLVVLLLTGCSSPPIRFHTLDPVSPASAPAVATDLLPIRIDSVTLPAELDRPEVVRRAGPGALDVAENDRWAGALDQIARQVLVRDLIERLPAGLMIRADDPAPPRKLRHLDIEIECFEGNLDGAVTLIAHWTILDGSADQKALRREERIGIPAGGSDLDGTVIGMSRALAALADRLAAAAVR